MESAGTQSRDLTNCYKSSFDVFVALLAICACAFIQSWEVLEAWQESFVLITSYIQSFSSRGFSMETFVKTLFTLLVGNILGYLLPNRTWWLRLGNEPNIWILVSSKYTSAPDDAFSSLTDRISGIIIIIVLVVILIASLFFRFFFLSFWITVLNRDCRDGTVEGKAGYYLRNGWKYTLSTCALNMYKIARHP